MSALTPEVIVLMTCHNRRETTRSALTALYGQQSEARIAAYVVDDGSSDGTAEMLRREFPDVTVIHGDGTAFWAGGMRLAQAVAWDAILRAKWVMLLNDDTLLNAEALDYMLDQASQFGSAVVAGLVVDSDSGAATYGGVVRESATRPLSFKLAAPGAAAVTFNANAALIAAPLFRRLGGLSTGYAHGMADFDLGLRATKVGAKIKVTEEPVATCSHNPVDGTWRDARLSRKERWRRLTSPKGLPPAEWARFCFRFGGVLAPVYAVLPYVRVLLGSTDREGIHGGSSPP